MGIENRKVLLIYPRFPSTYWGLQCALPLLGKKAVMPPLGLITVAAMLPAACHLRLIDLNCDPLSDEDILWADVVFLSAMKMQQTSLFEVARRCRTLGKHVVMGGPFPSLSPDECVSSCDTLVCDALLRSVPKDFRRAYGRFVLRILRTGPTRLDETLEVLVFGWHCHKFTLDRVLPQLDMQVARLQQTVEQP